MAPSATTVLACTVVSRPLSVTRLATLIVLPMAWVAVCWAWLWPFFLVSSAAPTRRSAVGNPVTRADQALGIDVELLVDVAADARRAGRRDVDDGHAIAGGVDDGTLSRGGVRMNREGQGLRPDHRAQAQGAQHAPGQRAQPGRELPPLRPPPAC